MSCLTWLLKAWRSCSSDSVPSALVAAGAGVALVVEASLASSGPGSEATVERWVEATAERWVEPRLERRGSGGPAAAARFARPRLGFCFGMVG